MKNTINNTYPSNYNTTINQANANQEWTIRCKRDSLIYAVNYVYNHVSSQPIDFAVYYKKYCSKAKYDFVDICSKRDIKLIVLLLTGTLPPY